ncbi:MAG: uracil phosphoribosyltransferase [Proteobacteria bacterium]|nr:uracil phosphoribosyltransferase [Pseudomonadota bacterium]
MTSAAAQNLQKQFKNLHVLDHPLITHKLSLMRMTETSSLSFRGLLKEIALLMGYEITRDLPLAHKRITTPVTATDALFLKGDSPVIVPILRAGLGMSEGLAELLPDAGMGHIGVYRDHETHMPVEYLVKLPETSGNRRFIVVDPMLATGHSAVHALNVLNARGVSDDRISFMALVAAPEGIRVFEEAHPNVPLYVAAVDEKLNDHAYIVPGLGDAGDRLFGTN